MDPWFDLRLPLYDLWLPLSNHPPKNNFGMPDLSLAKTFVIPVNAGSTTLDNITPDPVDNVFTDGPTSLSAPKNAVPSVPNFNLFLNTAAAYSWGFVIPSKLSSLVLAKALSKKLPLSSPNISPTDFCPVAETVVSAANAGNTQYPPYFARFTPYSPAFVAANFFAVLSASFVFAALPNNFFAIFCATAKPVPYCVNSEVNFATPPALSP